jgi:carboxylate-amine ligase
VSYRYPLAAFAGYGVEVEYMLVDRETLAVKPIADRLLEAQAGRVESEIEVGEVAWSNELALHVIELKTNGPVRRLPGLAALFQTSVARMNELLAPLGARLMPTGMHPWMQPDREFRLWPHEYGRVYETFHRIFDCRGHGWTNLQSTHLNLAFADDEEFGRLHAAIRLLLPLLPALAASSPLVEGRATGFLDARLHHYRRNAARVPSVSGQVVPEPVYGREAYEGVLLQGIYDDLAPLDPEGVLRSEWVNARGCIARFDRGAIEIRVLDVQECPRADLAIAAAVTAALRALVHEELAPRARQEKWETERLVAILADTIRDADAARVSDVEYLHDLGLPPRPCRAGEVWGQLLERTLARSSDYGEWREALDLMVEEGCLARRILTALAGDTRPERLREVYAALCDCLADGTLFRPRA